MATRLYLQSTGTAPFDPAIADGGWERNHGSYAARNSATATAHDAEGWYSCELNATDTNTLGPLTVKAHAAATHLPVWREFLVVPASVYDALVSGTGNGVRADVQTFAAGAITAAAIATGAIDADALAADAVAELADGVWDEAVAGHVGAGTFGGDVAVVGDLTNLDAAVSSRLATAGYTAPDNASIAAILADTGTDGVVVAAGSKTGYALTTAEHASVADKVLGRNIAGGSDAGRKVSEALAFLRNRWEISGTTLTVYASDDVTPLFTATITRTAADSVSQVDPA